MDATCDLTLPRFDPAQATVASAHPRRTRIPRNIVVEIGGFPSAADAARCFGARYHELGRAEYIAGIVHVDEGWGYLTPGKGPRNAKQVAVGALLKAYDAAGYRVKSIAHTHPYGQTHFSATDLQAVYRSKAELYMTNRRNETYRIDGKLLDKQLKGKQRGIRKLAQGSGFPGERVDPGSVDQSSDARGPSTGDK